MATALQDSAPGAGDLRVITLASASTPMPLHVPFRHELEGITVFRSQGGEGDSALYHLHVGYFASDSGARQALEVIRKYYAFATVERAPRDGMGSLEDTLNSDFEVLRTASARVVERRNPAPKPVQHFAVLLARRVYAEGPVSIPRLAAFRGFRIYAVRASGDDGDCQDIRLGFFGDVARAKQFADAVRGHFPQAAVLPISSREHARAAGLAPKAGAAAQPAVAARPEAVTRTPTARNASEIRSWVETFSL